MSKKIGQAIVIGGSVAGMLAARAIARHCGNVTILERDKIRASLDMRAGVPQAAHIHAVLTKGRNLLEQAFPGIVDEVIADGAIMIDHINDRRRLASYGWQPRFPSELRMLLVSRPLLESHIRARVSRLPNVQIETGMRVQGLTAQEGQVTGVIASPADNEDDERNLAADLVIDASGRSSNAPEWLEDLGFGTVKEMFVDAKWGYASRFYETLSPWPYDWQLINMWPQIRRNDAQKTRGGVLCPQDGGRCIVTLVGNAGDHPPRDDAGFLDFAASLVSPEIADFIRRAKPIGPINVSKTTVNKWRRFDQLERKPEKFIVVGDAVAAFNPVYGQGMSLAALEAKALDDSLTQWLEAGHDSLVGLAPMAQAKIAETGAFPWGASTGADSLVEGCVGASPPAPEVRAFSERAAALGSIHNDYVLKFEEMANLVRDNKWIADPEVKRTIVQNWDHLGQLVGAPSSNAPAAA